MLIILGFTQVILLRDAVYEKLLVPNICCDPRIPVFLQRFLVMWAWLVDLYRSLDLTGPLLLGGVPNLPEDFPVRNRNFVGCMRDLKIDSRTVDMAGFIANNGTTPGELWSPDKCCFIGLPVFEQVKVIFKGHHQFLNGFAWILANLHKKCKREDKKGTKMFWFSLFFF